MSNRSNFLFSSEKQPFFVSLPNYLPAGLYSQKAIGKAG